jgi:hypothetical protein
MNWPVRSARLFPPSPSGSRGGRPGATAGAEGGCRPAPEGRPCSSSKPSGARAATTGTMPVPSRTRKITIPITAIVTAITVAPSFGWANRGKRGLVGSGVASVRCRTGAHWARNSAMDFHGHTLACSDLAVCADALSPLPVSRSCRNRAGAVRAMIFKSSHPDRFSA